MIIILRTTLIVYILQTQAVPQGLAEASGGVHRRSAEWRPNIRPLTRTPRTIDCQNRIPRHGDSIQKTSEHEIRCVRFTAFT